MHVKSIPLVTLVCAAMLMLTACGSEPKILVFSKTAGYRHANIEAGVAAIQQLGKAEGFGVEATEDSTIFTEEHLKEYAAVVFLNTSGDVLNNWQQADFQRFIEAGGGFVGIHGAAATEYDWKWYGKLVGAFFDGHPAVQEAIVNVADKTHPATEDLPASWPGTDEWYNFKPVPPNDKVYVTGAKGNFTHSSTDSSEAAINVPPQVRWTYVSKQPFLSENIKVLLTLDESSYEGGKNGTSHPIAWAQEYEGGRSFYTGLGHTAERFTEANFLQHLLGGIKWAMDKRLDYTKAKTQRIPPSERFVRTVLAENLDEPTELAVFPDGSGKILFVERKGAIKIYYPEWDTVETIVHMPVYKEFEEGVMGVAFDPSYLENKWIYIFYSLMEGGRRNRLSRFEFKNDIIVHSTEKVLLEVPEQVGCCHTGGSIDFDSKGNLFLSTGDNTNPFESDGFAPADGRPGRELYDARRSSSNTNDLRGKILRITPQLDGTYTIPKGNLFPEGTPKTRPEIFVMGCRNPYRIAVDKQTDCVYWGDVGPDAGKNVVGRGSKGYDYWGRACEAGYYGWPLFRGNHIYYDHNFATKQSGPLHNPDKPINASPYNTGLRELPPVTPPLIWYSYDESLEFPWLGTGGKNPMAGPVYRRELAVDGWQSVYGKGQAANVFPEYFDGKFFIYEWMRNWIYVVTMDEKGHFVQADPFLPNEKFSRPMDMAFGPDGALYVLEYGTQWFAQNPDARLNKIEYAPTNRKPIAKLKASKTEGAAPLRVHLYASESVDYDGDKLSFAWAVNGKTVSNYAALEYVFELPGEYNVTVRVSDPSGASSRAAVKVVVGNSKPKVAWHLEGNQSFYWDDTELPYRLEVTDEEDGSLAGGKLDPRRVKISIDYLAEGQDVAAIVMGHQTQSSAMGSLQFATGFKLIEQNDCKTCHAVDSKVNGPSYIDVANRYYGSEFAMQQLSEKVIKGGAGNWGETAMSAHPNLTKVQAEDIVKYILSLAGEVQSTASIPFSGSYRMNAHVGKGEQGAYVFQASYRDRGSLNGSHVLSDKQTLVLRYPKLEAETYSRAAKGVRRERVGQTDTMAVTDLMDGRWIAFDSIDLTGVGSVRLGFLAADQLLPGSTIEVRLGSEGGKLLGKADLGSREATVPLQAATGMQNLVLVFRNNKTKGQGMGRLDWVGLGKR